MRCISSQQGNAEYLASSCCCDTWDPKYPRQSRLSHPRVLTSTLMRLPTPATNLGSPTRTTGCQSLTVIDANTPRIEDALSESPRPAPLLVPNRHNIIPVLNNPEPFSGLIGIVVPGAAGCRMWYATGHLAGRVGRGLRRGLEGGAERLERSPRRRECQSRATPAGAAGAGVEAHFRRGAAARNCANAVAAWQTPRNGRGTRSEWPGDTHGFASRLCKTIPTTCFDQLVSTRGAISGLRRHSRPRVARDKTLPRIHAGRAPTLDVVWQCRSDGEIAAPQQYSTAPTVLVAPPEVTVTDALKADGLTRRA